MVHDNPTHPDPDARTTARRLARGIVAMARTRLELLLVELQEERERCVIALLLALGCAACGFLACVALTAGWMAVAWPLSPVLAVTVPVAVYTVAAVFLYRRLRAMLDDWQAFPETGEQLRKDRECLENWLN